MQAAGALEHALRRAQACRAATTIIARRARGPLARRASQRDLDRRRSTPCRTRRSSRSRRSCARRRRRRTARAEVDRHHVVLLLGSAVRAVADRARRPRGRDQALAVQEPGGQLEVVARRAHRHRDAPVRWPGPRARISSGSSVARRSRRRRLSAPSTSTTRTGPLGPRSGAISVIAETSIASAIPRTVLAADDLGTPVRPGFRPPSRRGAARAAGCGARGPARARRPRAGSCCCPAKRRSSLSASAIVRPRAYTRSDVMALYASLTATTSGSTAAAIPMGSPAMDDPDRGARGGGQRRVQRHHIGSRVRTGPRDGRGAHELRRSAGSSTTRAWSTRSRRPSSSATGSSRSASTRRRPETGPDGHSEVVGRENRTGNG